MTGDAANGKSSYDKGFRDGGRAMKEAGTYDRIYAKGYTAGKNYTRRDRVPPPPVIVNVIGVDRTAKVLGNLLEAADRLGNHLSIQLIKHEIRKEMESLRHEACNERSR